MLIETPKIRFEYNWVKMNIYKTELGNGKVIPFPHVDFVSTQEIILPLSLVKSHYGVLQNSAAFDNPHIKADSSTSGVCFDFYKGNLNDLSVRTIAKHFDLACWTYSRNSLFVLPASKEQLDNFIQALRSDAIELPANPISIREQIRIVTDIDAWEKLFEEKTSSSEAFDATLYQMNQTLDKWLEKRPQSTEKILDDWSARTKNWKEREQTFIEDMQKLASYGETKHEEMVKSLILLQEAVIKAQLEKSREMIQPEKLLLTDSFSQPECTFTNFDGTPARAIRNGNMSEYPVRSRAEVEYPRRDKNRPEDKRGQLITHKFPQMNSLFNGDVKLPQYMVKATKPVEWTDKHGQRIMEISKMQIEMKVDAQGNIAYFTAVPKTDSSRPDLEISKSDFAIVDNPTDLGNLYHMLPTLPADMQAALSAAISAFSSVTPYSAAEITNRISEICKENPPTVFLDGEAVQVYFDEKMKAGRIALLDEPHEDDRNIYDLRDFANTELVNLHDRYKRLEGGRYYPVFIFNDRFRKSVSYIIRQFENFSDQALFGLSETLKDHARSKYNLTDCCSEKALHAFRLDFEANLANLYRKELLKHLDSCEAAECNHVFNPKVFESRFSVGYSGYI